MDVKRFKLKELLTIGNGKDYSSLGDGIYPVYGSGGFMRSVDSYLYEGESVLLLRKGTLSNIQFVSGKFWTVDTCYYSIINTSIVLPYYLFRLLRSFDLSGFDSGASIPSMTSKTYYRIKINLPDVITQERISNVLLRYDKLIEVNNKRIKALEQMAENLYKEWFVRFRFPGHENAEFEDSKMGKIPVGFSVKKMQDVISRYIGGGWGNDEEDKDYVVEAYVIRGTDFPNVKKGNLSSCPYRYHKKSNYKSRELHDLDIVLEVSGGTADQPVGRTLLVTQDVIDRLGGQVICASFCKQIQLKKDEVSPYYYYYWMNYLYDTRIIDRFQLQSTGIINFQFEYFVRKCEILLPPKELMQRFDQLIVPIYNSISTL